MVVKPCTRCGALTEWDAALGPQPLCVTCFDAAVDAGQDPQQQQRAPAGMGRQSEKYRRYRLTHKTQRNAYQRWWRKQKKEAV